MSYDVLACQAASRAGVTVAGWRTRRHREGSRHPHHIRIGNVVLYNETSLSNYLDAYRDGRRR